MTLNTDICCRAGDEIVNCYVKITATTPGDFIDKIPEVPIIVNGPFDAGTQNNQSGRYGYIAFGYLTVTGVYYFEERHLISYWNQIFFPSQPNYGCVRVWLEYGVAADIIPTNISATIKIISALSNIVLNLIAKGVGNAPPPNIKLIGTSPP
jgi:hypothetical protein